MREIYYVYFYDKLAFEMRSLNLDQLRALTTVAEQRSFSAAARQLHLTQPAISLQIKTLEERFGVRLIERLGKQAHATEAGRDLIAAAERILGACDEAERLMRRYRDGWLGRVSLGTINTVFSYDLPPVLRRLRKEHPGVELQIINLPTSESVEGILQNRLDIAIITLPVESRQLRITPLRDEQMVAICPRSMGDVPDVVTPAYAATKPLLMEHERAASHGLVTRWLDQARVQASVPMRLGSIEALKSAVAADLGMSIIPEIAARADDPDMVVRPLAPPLPSTIALIEHASKPNQPALAIVRRALLALRERSRR
jgi:DNA-binding transcriptional LysR family regulator